MRYRFFISRKPALTVCLLLIALWEPESSARRTAGDSAAVSVRINGQDVSTYLTAGVGEPLQPKPKAPNRLDSPRLIALARKVNAGNRAAAKSDLTRRSCPTHKARRYCVWGTQTSGF